MKKPDIRDFIKALDICGGNLSAAAKTLGVSRGSVNNWVNEDTDFANAVKDSRGRILDECITTARIVALGIPEKDPSGKMIGWASPPDGSMLRYLMSTLGRNEGFGDQSTTAVNVNINHPRTLTKEEAREYGLKLDKEY